MIQLMYRILVIWSVSHAFDRSFTDSFWGRTSVFVGTSDAFIGVAQLMEIIITLLCIP